MVKTEIRQLCLMPSQDKKLITSDWLLSIGFKRFGNYIFELIHDFDECYSVCLELNIRRNQWVIGTGNPRQHVICRLHEDYNAPKTEGDLRQLCKTLNIPLKG